MSAFEEPNEHRMIEALRASGQVALELVAETESGEIAGHICFSRLMGPDGWWALAPITVSNSHQNQGAGSELIIYGLDAARQAGAEAVVVVGGPSYFRRFGFVFEGAVQAKGPYPEQYTGVFPIAPDSASAQVELLYPPAFGAA